MKRNRKLLNAVTALALLLALLPAGAAPARADDSKYVDVDTWAALEEAFLGAERSSARIRLTADVKPTNPQESSPLTITSGWVDLDLNGHTIDRGLQTGAKEDGCVIKAYDAHLVIGDNSDNHSGTITGGNTKGSGGGIYADCSEVTLYAGEIGANIASGTGGGVYLCEESTLLMTGGSISQNEAKYGGGVHAFSSPADNYTCSIDMRGGSISNNYARIGSGVYLRHSELAMSGGSITGNQSTMADENALRGGVVVDEASSFQASGTVSITDNADGDLLLVAPLGQEIKTVTALKNDLLEKELNADSRIGVSRYVVSRPFPEDDPDLLYPVYPTGGMVTGGMGTYLGGEDNFFSNHANYTAEIETQGDYAGEVKLVPKSWTLAYDLSSGTAAGASPGVVATNPDAARSATLVGAWYDADGRLLGVAAQRVTVDNGTSRFTLSPPAAAEDADSCRAFLLGSGFAPLCPSAAASR